MPYARKIADANADADAGEVLGAGKAIGVAAGVVKDVREGIKLRDRPAYRIAAGLLGFRRDVVIGERFIWVDRSYLYGAGFRGDTFERRGRTVCTKPSPVSSTVKLIDPDRVLKIRGLEPDDAEQLYRAVRGWLGFFSN